MIGYLLVAVLCSFSLFTKAAKPNILLLFPDQWRADWADDYFIPNLEINLPTFNNFVKTGTRFTRVNVGSPLCAPSRACIAGGREYDYTGVPTNHQDFPENQTTIYQLMRDVAGYHVMVSGKDDLVKSTGTPCPYRTVPYGPRNSPPHKIQTNKQAVESTAITEPPN